MKRAVCLTLLLFWIAPVLQTDAQQHLTDSLEAIVARGTRDSVSVNALLTLSYEYARTNTDKAKKCAYRAIDLANGLGIPLKLSGAFTQLVSIHLNTGQIDSARYFLEQSKSLAEENAENWKLKTNYLQSAGLLYKNTGNPREALPFMVACALELERGAPGTVGLAGQYLNIGNTYMNLGEMRKAANYHIKALELFESLENLRGQSFCLQSLGNDFRELKVYGAAKTYYERSLRIKEKLMDNRGIGTALTGLGTVARMENRFDEGMEYLKAALEKAKELNLVVEEGKIIYEMARIEAARSNNERALALYDESIKKVRTSSDTSLLSRIKADRIGIVNVKNTHEIREKSLHERVEVASLSGDVPSLTDGYKDLSRHYASVHQYDKAYDYLQKHLLLNDSIRGSEVLIQFKNIEQAYEREKNEKEIALLKKDQELKAAIIAKQNANQYMIAIGFASVVFIAWILFNRFRTVSRVQRQVEIEKVRNHIARDLHDDIGSTLSSINLISNLALHGSSDSRKHLERIAEHSGRMMENMSDIVWSISPSHDSFDQVISKMKEFAATILEPKNINYSISGEEEVCSIPVDIEKRKNLFLIFKEAINNIAKYSEATEVTVQFSRHNNEVHFSITDNGTGFDPGMIKPGNGLRNMEARAKSFNGSLSLETKSAIKGGTRIAVTFAIT